MGLYTSFYEFFMGKLLRIGLLMLLKLPSVLRSFFDGVLIICGDNVGTVGRLPGIVQTPEFMVDL